MREEQVGKGHALGGEGREDGEEIGPEKADAGDFVVKERVARGFGGEVDVRIGVEIEASEGEDDVVELVPACELLLLAGSEPPGRAISCTAAERGQVFVHLER